MHVTNSHFLDELKNAKNLLKIDDYCDFSPFTKLISPCRRDKNESFPFILLKFVMHVANKQFSDKFNICLKIGRFITFFLPSVIPMTLTFFSINNFFVNAIHATFFYVASQFLPFIHFTNILDDRTRYSSYTITIEQNVRFQGGYALKKNLVWYYA